MSLCFSGMGALLCFVLKLELNSNEMGLGSEAEKDCMIVDYVQERIKMQQRERDLTVSYGLRKPGL